ncbi:hypothetical protein [Rubrivirga sp. IMCC45206]|uniref:hypothetical protein n=1 Tax=Rubrivirga sp. IMCC45206 TaxID=3391614 RepID=UPI00398FF534
MNARLAVVGLALAVVLLIAYVALAPGASPPPPEPTATVSAAAPSASNVDPGIHARLMQLRADADAAPDDLDAQLEYARMAAGAHRGAEAAEALERAVALAPEQRQPWLDLANAYGAAEDWDAVAGASRRMLARFPDDGEAQYNLGAAHANAGRRAEAEAAWASVAAGDGPLAAQAQGSLVRLAALANAPPTPPAAPAGSATAPPLSAGATLPAGHPPLPPDHPTVGADGIQTRVVGGGAADPTRVRSLVTELAGQ